MLVCCVVVREIDRSPLANSMPIRVTGLCTVDWSSQNIGSYVEIQIKEHFPLGSLTLAYCPDSAYWHISSNIWFALIIATSCAASLLGSKPAFSIPSKHSS